MLPLRPGVLTVARGKLCCCYGPCMLQLHVVKHFSLIYWHVTTHPVVDVLNCERAAHRRIVNLLKIILLLMCCLLGQAQVHLELSCNEVQTAAPFSVSLPFILPFILSFLPSLPFYFFPLPCLPSILPLFQLLPDLCRFTIY